MSDLIEKEAERVLAGKEKSNCRYTAHHPGAQQLECTTLQHNLYSGVLYLEYPDSGSQTAGSSDAVLQDLDTLGQEGDWGAAYRGGELHPQQLGLHRQQV